MCRRQGLADEEYALDDEDEDEHVEGDEDEEPLLVTRAHKHTNGNGAVPSYGYRDLFGKEAEMRRRQLIEVKMLRAETDLQFPGCVEIIPQLQHELRLLYEETKDLRSQEDDTNHRSQDAHGDGGVNGSSELVQQVATLQKQLAARDAKLREAESEAARLRARLADTGGNRESSSDELQELEYQLKELKVTLAAKDKELATLRAKAGSTGGAESNAQLAKQRDDAVQARELLQQQLAQARAEVTAAEANFRAQQEALSASTESEQAKALQKQLWALTEQHNKRVAELEAEMRQQKVLIKQLQTTKSDMMQDMKTKVEAVKAESAAAYKASLKTVQAQLDELHALREGVLEELLHFQSECLSEKTITQMTRVVRDKDILRVRQAQQDLRKQLADFDARLKESQEEVQTVRAEAAQTIRIKELEAAGQISHFREKWRVEFDKRRKLHNTVLELKGNIRVLCRVRPLLEKERSVTANGGEMPVKAMSEEVLRVAAVDNKAEKEFEFDRVLAPDEGQDKLYDEVAALVTSVLDGFNVAIMAYGQTGSGKTYTMEGPEGNPGVNLRALGDLFRIAEERASAFTTTFSASVLEIYNEQIYDLLMSGAQDGDKLDVKQGPEGMYVPGLKLEEVKDMADVTAMIGRGKSNRSTYATNMNEHSSRSHLVLSVYVNSVNKLNGNILRGKLHLIDLAGSERLSRTGAQGDRLKEAQAINKSLSALGDVIQALQQRNAHIPYRNSKLTRLLEDSLGGNSKCVMIVNVSPATENVSETKCSLEFASRARKVELGRARANVVSTEGGNGNGSGSGGGATGASPIPPRSGRATPAGEGTMSRVGSREAMSTPVGRRSTGASSLGR
ncbi:hypothetical protein GPECTOR_40g569 [Gonium pectorale]|uniref:Kinesin-like protein n=1 Tax=Gonium pectorale TaxID=33097 RepID=A0A150GB79_GONPE|nr:hypothetical protein GPECTOR_40g569 [Gonium pectorale]|eukprot:KXZ46835.1 hypothetical protein GPECTOR_40g569 [Gonium pectorale]